MSLLNERDLTGWKPLSKTGRTPEWRVEDGVLVGAEPTGWLVWNGPAFRNFVLTADVWINAGGNSGIAIRSDPAVTDYLDVEIFSSRTGTLVGKDEYRTKYVPSSITVNEWFSIEVRAVENNVQIKLNNGNSGIAEYALPSLHLQNGTIALQIYGGEGPSRKTLVKFRGIKVAILD